MVVGHVFHQGVADALDDAALGLNPGQRRVDGNAAVHYRHVVENGHKAGDDRVDDAHDHQRAHAPQQAELHRTY